MTGQFRAFEFSSGGAFSAVRKIALHFPVKLSTTSARGMKVGKRVYFEELITFVLSKFMSFLLKIDSRSPFSHVIRFVTRL